MSIYSLISSAKASADRNPPLYEDANTEGTAVITKVLRMSSRKKQNFAVFELKVDDARSKTGGFAPAKGTPRVVMFNLDDDAGPGWTKTFILRAIGADEKSVSPEDLADTLKAIFEDGALVGVKIAYDVRPHTTKTGKEVNVVTFSHVPGQTPEMVAKERESLGG